MTGVTTVWMTAVLDEGPTFLSASTPIEPDENAGSLGVRLAELGARCLSDTLARIERGEIVRVKQDSSRASYAPRLASEDALLSLGDDPATFSRKVRAFAPEPGAYLELVRGRLIILAASLGDTAAPAADSLDGAETPGTVRALDRERGLELRLRRGSVWLRTVRPSGRSTMSGYDYGNGLRLKRGARLPVKV